MRRIGKISWGWVAVGIAAVIAVIATTFLPDRRAPEAPPAPTVVLQRPVDLRSAIAEIASAERREDLERIYAAAGDAPLWSGSWSARRRLSDLTDAREVIAAQGLDTSRLIAAHEALSSARTEERVRQDIRVTEELLAIARGLRFGQVAAMDDWYIPADRADIVPDFAAALKAGKISAYLREVPPNDAAYTALIAALARYREIAANGGWPAIVSEAELSLAAEDPRTEALRRRLIAEDYLAESADRNRSTLIEAVKAFQARNGLESDGRIGRGTLAALNISADARVGQILANLERRRHMPRPTPSEYVAVNAADQTLELVKNGEPVLRLRTIVGDRKHPTPMLSLKMSAVTMNPNWEIPPSIAAREILPHLRRNPHYLVENDMVIVDGPSQDPQGVRVRWEKITASAFPYRLRQLPGPRNSLGEVKFEMWNDFNIYLHDTPGRHLFAKPERYLSHGCVRVDQPLELAREVMADQREWDEDVVAELLSTGETKTTRLARPRPVYILYWTAFHDDTGTLQFRNDAYGRDAPVAAALGYAPRRAAAQVVRAGPG